MLGVTPRAKCFQIVQMVIATERTVFAAARNAVVHFHAFRFFCEPIRPHRRAIAGVRRETYFRRAFRRGGAALRAAILIAPFSGAARKRPPVVFPKRIGAAIATPGAAPRGQRGPAPSTPTGSGLRKRADGEQRCALGRIQALAPAPATSLRHVKYIIARATPTDAAAKNRNASVSANDVVCVPKN